MPKQHMEHQVPCTDSTVTGPRCGLELTGELTAFCTHFPWDEELTPWWLGWLHVSISVKTMCFLNSAKIPCIAYHVLTIGLIDSGPLTQLFSFTSLPSILSKSLIQVSALTSYIASSQPCLNHVWLASPCVFPITSPCLSILRLPFHFPPSSPSSRTHTHPCNHF